MNVMLVIRLKKVQRVIKVMKCMKCISQMKVISTEEQAWHTPGMAEG